MKKPTGAPSSAAARRRDRQEREKRSLLVLAANRSWTLRNFCSGLIKGLHEANYEIAAIVPADGGASELERMGVSVHTVPLSAHGLSPLADLRLLANYLKLLRRLRPAAFIGFTVKPNIYGSIAARICGIPTVNHVIGLGTAFLSSRVLEALVSGLYRLGLRGSKRVFFLNHDDWALFLARRIVTERNSAIIPGSGIDLDWFSPPPQRTGDQRLTFLFIGRLLTDKGVGELLEAARIVKEHDHDIVFRILGPNDPHPKAVPPDMLARYAADGIVEVLGSTDDVRPHIASADCVVLPSYREGLPRVLVEAGALARPVIASDVPGCREVVEEGVTGFLCQARSVEALASAILKLSHLSQEERTAMGEAARLKVEREYGDEHIIAAHLSLLDETVRH